MITNWLVGRAAGKSRAENAETTFDFSTAKKGSNSHTPVMRLNEPGYSWTGLLEEKQKKNKIQPGSSF